MACRPRSDILMPIGSRLRSRPHTIILPCGRLVQILPSASLVNRGSRAPYWHKNGLTVLPLQIHFESGYVFKSYGNVWWEVGKVGDFEKELS